MRKFFYGMAMASGMLLAMSPLFLVLGLVSIDIQRFVHYWFVFCLTMLITLFVSAVLMQMVDK